MITDGRRAVSVAPAASERLATAEQVRPTADGNSVDLEYEASNEKLDRWADTHGAPPIIVATGFIAKDPKVAGFPGRSLNTWLGIVSLFQGWVFACHRCQGRRIRCSETSR
jgi:hypothetical protein